MNTVKKLICFICAICLFSLPCVCAEGKIDYSEEMEFLSKLGVDTDEINAGTKITRGQTAVAFAGALNLEKTAGMPKQLYLDVNSAHEAYSAVYALRIGGILSNADDGMFRPDDEMTYNELVKMAASALGYEKFAQAKGGWPNGYIEAARDAGILKKIDADGVITKAEVYAVLYNVLFADMLEIGEVKQDKNGDPQIKFKKGEKAISSYHNIEKASGQIWATYYASIYGKTASSENSVIIDGKAYEAVAEIGINDIGAEVDYYINDDDVVYMIIPKDSVQYSFDYNEIGSGTTPKKVCYYDENGKEKSLRVADDAYYMLNARAVINPTSEQMIPKYGKIELIDNGDDDVIDVVKIWNYKSYYIKSMGADRFFVSENEDNITYVQYKDFEKDVIVFDKHMNRISESSIQAGKVVTLAESDDTMIIFVSDETFSGTLEAESADGTVIIDGLSYNYLLSCKIGDSFGKYMKYHMDVNETLVYAEKEEDTDYAVICAVASPSEIGAEYAEVKLYDKGYFDIYKTESKIRYSEDGGATYTSIPCTELYDKFYDTTKGRIRYELVKFSLRDNKIKTIIRARKPAAGANSLEANEDEFRLNMDYGEDAEWNIGTRQVMYRSGDSSINYMWSNTGTFVYIMNPDEDQCTYSTMADTFGGHYATYKDSAQYYTNVRGYEMTEMGVLRYLLIETDKIVEKKTTVSSALAMVTGNRKILDTDGSAVDAVEAYENENGTRAVPIKSDLIPVNENLKNSVRGSHTRYAAGTVAFGDLKKGDIIQYVKDTFTGRVTAFTLLCRAEDIEKDYCNNNFNTNQWDSVITGNIEEKSKFGIRVRGNAIEHAVYGNSIPVMMEAEVTTTEAFDKVYRFKKDENKFELLTPNDMYEGARIWCFVEDKYFQAGVIVVIIE